MRKLKELVKGTPFVYHLLTDTREFVRLVRYTFFDFSQGLRYIMRKPRLKKGGYRYEVLMLAHFLEKGMCYANPRPFGHRHVRNIMKMLDCFKPEERDDFEYQAGLSTLRAWLAVFERHGWTAQHPLTGEVQAYLKDKADHAVPIGVLHAGPEGLDVRQELLSTGFEDHCLLTRHSVRDFSDQPLSGADLVFALDSFRAAPVACNRQLCKLYYIKNPAMREYLHKAVPGIGGLNKKTLHYFIVAFDVAGLVGARERHQGYLNAGLVSMNFVNGLHASGLGACMMQWDKNPRAEKRANQALKLPANERIAVVIAAGHLAPDYPVPISVRRPMRDLYEERD